MKTKQRLWVVEVFREQQWLPTGSVGLDRATGLREKRRLGREFPYHLFHLEKYVREK